MILHLDFSFILTAAEWTWENKGDIAVGLLIISEFLPLSPKIKANSNWQLLRDIIMLIARRRKTEIPSKEEDNGRKD